MPRRDGTGPVGSGPITGRGLGPCTGARPIRFGMGLGIGLGRRLFRRRGPGRGFSINRGSARTPR